MTGALSAGGCDQCAKCGREELPHVRGQGQKLGGPHARRAVAKSTRLRQCRNAERSYPASKVRGAAERSYPMSGIRGGGREEIPLVLFIIKTIKYFKQKVKNLQSGKKKE